MKKYILFAASLLVGIGLIVSIQSTYAATPVAGVISAGPNLFYSVGSSTAEVVGTATTRILATSTGRTWTRISNNSANPITCTYKNGAPAIIGQGFIITASSTFSMNQLTEPVYTGTIQCISNTGVAATVFVEVNQ